MVVFSIIYGYAVAIGAINVISIDEEIGSVLLLKLKYLAILYIHRHECAAWLKAKYHEDIEKSWVECAARPKSFHEKHSEASQLVKRESSLLVMYCIDLCNVFVVYLYPFVFAM